MRGGMMGQLQGKRALITGGTTGLGLAIAEAFVREGARVVITGRDEPLGAKAQAILGEGSLFLRADVSDASQVGASVARAVDHLSGLDILVNNAGIAVAAGALETPLVEFDRLMNVNVRGAFCYAQAAFPHLKASGGCIINMASDAGVIGEAEIAVYSVSKAALIMLSNMLAVEAGRQGVRSNALCPGDISPGMRHVVDANGPVSQDDPSSWPIPPIGRVGRAQDVAEAAVFLASERASFINGVALLLDGGMRTAMRSATNLRG
jgi:NAD(P)-dependent dehydrogenase (short-subunit alcohol dehydrogenase family)